MIYPLKNKAYIIKSSLQLAALVANKERERCDESVSRDFFHYFPFFPVSVRWLR